LNAKIVDAKNQKSNIENKRKALIKRNKEITEFIDQQREVKDKYDLKVLEIKSNKDHVSDMKLHQIELNRDHEKNCEFVIKVSEEKSKIEGHLKDRNAKIYKNLQKDVDYYNDNENELQNQRNVDRTN
jgi:hypothetical protein